MAKKLLTFAIIQEGIEYSASIKSIESTNKDAILKQIKGRLLQLMLLRKQTGQQCGLKLNKPIGFVFKVGRKKVNTLTLAEQLNVSLKIGNSEARRKKFFATVESLTEFILRGDKAYSNKEIESIEAELEAFLSAEAEVRNANKEVIETAEVSAN